MPFEKGQSGNPNGRPSGTKQNARQIGRNKLKKILRTLEPLADDSIDFAASLMGEEKASHATRLKAATTILEKYIALVNQAYMEEDKVKQDTGTAPSEESDEDKEDDQPRLRLTAPAK